MDHRLQTAQHLRYNASRNGNANLLRTAENMEQRAYEHYDSQLDRLGKDTDGGTLNGIVPNPPLTVNDIVPDSQPSPNPVAYREPHGSLSVQDSPENDFQPLDSAREWEERKLRHLFDVAQKLREIAGRNGNENLLRTAERVEQIAITRYERNSKLWEGQKSELTASELTPVPSATIAARP